jgi:DNA-binding IclR family transcriptional regulator
LVAADDKPGWTFLTNHSHVLLCIAEDPGIRGRDIAERVGITERSAQSIIADLVEGGYLTREKIGRRNQYQIHPDLPLRHPVERDSQVSELLRLVKASKRRASA